MIAQGARVVVRWSPTPGAVFETGIVVAVDYDRRRVKVLVDGSQWRAPAWVPLAVVYPLPAQFPEDSEAPMLAAWPAAVILSAVVGLLGLMGWIVWH